MDNDTNKCGEVIREARLKNNLTIAQLAEKINISDRYLQKIENENKIPSYKVLKKIINLLMIDANSLYYINVEMSNDDYDFICRKMKKCTESQLRILKATLNAILDDE